MTHGNQTNIRFPTFKNVLRFRDNQQERDDFVVGELQRLNPGQRILDAGCGSQRYRQYCSHLIYSAQDFGKYTVDNKKALGSDGVGGVDGYAYGNLDYTGDIWSIQEADGVFDAILCTEVLEHIPYPNETMAEFARLLKPGGRLILTAPSNCLRHMDPYFYYSGFSDRWYETILGNNGFAIERLLAVGDYYSWLTFELARTGRQQSILGKLALAPALIFLYFRRRNEASVNTLCMGYHVVAIRA